MRHAKSSRENPNLKDIERPLLPKGERRAMVISEKLGMNGITPDMILCSPAIRARETARIVVESLGLSNERIQIENDIYFGSITDMIDLLKTLPEDVESVVMVGHNPTITELCNRFNTFQIENLTTAGLVAFGFEADSWEHLSYGNAKHLFTLIEKN